MDLGFPERNVDGLGISRKDIEDSLEEPLGRRGKIRVEGFVENNEK